MRSWKRCLPLLLGLLLAGCVSPVRQVADLTAPSSDPMTINGITFQEEPVGLGCPEPLQDATPEQIAASPINFALEYLPEGYALEAEAASACQGTVVSLGKRYVGPQGAINVARFTKRVAPMPGETPTPIQVAGRQGAIFGTPSGTTVILAEPFGITEVTVDKLDRSEVLRIVEGIREGGNRGFITREDAIAAVRKFLPPRTGETVTATLNPSWVYEGKAGRQTIPVWLVTYQSPGGARTVVVIDAVTGASRGVLEVEAGK